MKNFNPSKKIINIVIGIFIVMFALYVLISSNLQTANIFNFINTDTQVTYPDSDNASGSASEAENKTDTSSTPENETSADAKRSIKDINTGLNVAEPSNGSGSNKKKSSPASNSGSNGGSSGNIKENPSDYIE